MVMSRLRRHPGGTRWVVAAWFALAGTGLHAQQPAAVTSDAPVGAAEVEPSARRLSDPAITAAVERELDRDPLLVRDRIDVTTEQGTVTLRGTAAPLLLKERAQTIVESVRGVRAVINELEVQRGPDVSGLQLRERIAAALQADPATELIEIAVQADDRGAVTLRGTVASLAERYLAVQIAKSIAGVVEVRDELQVRVARQRSDQQIEAEVERLLQWNALVDASNLEVSVHWGTVRLIGSVRSLAEKNLAVELSRVAGVREVDSRPLLVEQRAMSTQGGQRDTTVQLRRADADILRSVQLALSHRPPLAGVRAAVDGGLVRLRGSVTTLYAKATAEIVASSIVGVRGVRNLVRIVPGREVLTDAQMSARIREHFARSAILEDHEIMVRVRDAVATLLGTVDGWFERGTARDLAARVPGVRHIRNHLAVDDDAENYVLGPLSQVWPFDQVWPTARARLRAPAVLPADPVLAAEIATELWWSPMLATAEIRVEVDRGIATLSGTVYGPAEGAAAIEEAFEGGAVGVIDELQTRVIPTGSD